MILQAQIRFFAGRCIYGRGQFSVFRDPHSWNTVISRAILKALKGFFSGKNFKMCNSEVHISAFRGFITARSGFYKHFAANI